MGGGEGEIDELHCRIQAVMRLRRCAADAVWQSEWWIEVGREYRRSARLTSGSNIYRTPHIAITPSRTTTVDRNQNP